MTPLSVAQVDACLAQHCFSFGTQSVSLEGSAGRVLAQGINADRDLPPFDRVMMDGFALSFDDIQLGIVNFRRTDIQAAGEHAKVYQGSGTAIEIMTGAILPIGASLTIVPVENTFPDPHNDKCVHVKILPTRPLQYVHVKGSDVHAGTVLLEPGTVMGPLETALCASVGLTHVTVARRPRVAIVATGDEVVAVGQRTHDFQIHASNALMLNSLLRFACEAVSMFQVRDDLQEMRRILQTALRCNDVVLVTGGVSVGKFDFVPQVLLDLGVQRHFHRVCQRPGKPLWFGSFQDRIAVFGLPGNPVSTLLCALRYVLPWIEQASGRAVRSPQVFQLDSLVPACGELTQFVPVKVQTHAAARGRLEATRIANNGSGDLVNIRHCDGFIEINETGGSRGPMIFIPCSTV